jgi:hypothetical protein
MDDKGEMKEDLKLPDDEYGAKIKELFNADKEVLVTVVKAMGTEGIVAVKEAN